MTSFCSFSINTSKNSIFLLSVAVSICPAESAPAAKANNSVAIASHCFPAAIKSLARSFSCKKYAKMSELHIIKINFIPYLILYFTLVDKFMYKLDNLAAVSTGAGETKTNSSIGILL